MKIALVSEWVDAWRGGAETSTLQFVHRLMDRGVELHLFTRSRPSPTPGLHVHVVNGAGMSRTRQTVIFTHRVDRLIRRNRFDVVHAISPCLSATVYQPRGGTVAETIERNVALRTTRSGRAMKRCVNRLNLKQRYSLRIERRLMGREDGPVIVAISDYVVRQLKQHYRLPDSRIRKIYNGVEPYRGNHAQREADRSSVRAEFNISQSELLVILIAHNFRLKGVYCWMHALAELCKRGKHNIRSLVIGKGDSREWHALAARLGITDCLTFTGPTDRIQAFQHAADVLVHPTFYDPCSRVVLESMIAGLPCITTRWDGAAEMITHGVNGFVLDAPGDRDGLCALVTKLGDPRLRVSMGERAQAVAQQVSMQRHAEQVMALYDELVGVPCPG